MTQWYVACGYLIRENFNPLPGKAVYKAKAVLNTYELFICGNMNYIANSFCKYVLKVTPLPVL
jgi:hypothetical protein